MTEEEKEFHLVWMIYLNVLYAKKISETVLNEMICFLWCLIDGHDKNTSDGDPA